MGACFPPQALLSVQLHAATRKKESEEEEADQEGDSEEEEDQPLAPTAN
jgi:hypothetical protein